MLPPKIFGAVYRGGNVAMVTGHVTGSRTHIIGEHGDKRELFHYDKGLNVFCYVLSFVHYLQVVKLERGGGGGK